MKRGFEAIPFQVMIQCGNVLPSLKYPEEVPAQHGSKDPTEKMQELPDFEEKAPVITDACGERERDRWIYIYS